MGPASGASAGAGRGKPGWIPCVDDGGSSQEAATRTAWELCPLITAVCLADPVGQHAEGAQGGCERSVRISPRFCSRASCRSVSPGLLGPRDSGCLHVHPQTRKKLRTSTFFSAHRF